MSNKSSPPSRSARTTPSSTRRRTRSVRIDNKARAEEISAEPESMKDRVRRYLPTIGIPHLLLVLGITVVCLATILLTGGRVAALPASIAEAWFILHAAPVSFDGVTLGAIPLLPAIGVAAFIARRVRVATRARVSILDLYALFGLVVLIPFILSAIAWFMLADASTVFPVSPPAVHKALFIPVAVHVIGMACGMGEKLWRALFARLEVPAALIDATKAAARLAVRLLGASLVVFLILLAVGYPRIQELLGAFPNLDGGGPLGLIVLSVLYVPNAAVHMLGVLLGAPFKIAQGSVSLFSAELVPLPPLPLFGAVPPVIPAWAPVLMVIPAAAIIHFVVRRHLGGLEVLAGAVAAALMAAAAGLFAGGNVGAYGWVGLNPWIFALAVMAWVGIIAGIAWAVAATKQTRGKSEAASEDEPAEPVEPVEPAENVGDSFDEGGAEVEGKEEPELGGSTVVTLPDADADEPEESEKD